MTLKLSTDVIDMTSFLVHNIAVTDLVANRLKQLGIVSKQPFQELGSSNTPTLLKGFFLVPKTEYDGLDQKTDGSLTGVIIKFYIFLGDFFFFLFLNSSKDLLLVLFFLLLDITKKS